MAPRPICASHRPICRGRRHHFGLLASLVFVCLTALAISPSHAAALSGVVTGTVYQDLNDNGTQDAGEPGIGGVAIVAHGPLGILQFGNTTTAADGTYTLTISGAASSSVVVEFSVPAGLAPASPATPNDDDKQTVTIGGTADLGLIASPAPTATIGDRVWTDSNGNGTQDAGEPGAAGVSVELLDSTGATVMATTTTDAAGSYQFSSPTVVAGTDYIVGLPAQNKQQPVSVPAAGGAISTIDFGLVPLSNLTVHLWSDTGGATKTANGTIDAGEVGIAGVPVLLATSAHAVVATITSNATGDALFTTVLAGSYTVTIEPSAFAVGGKLVGRSGVRSIVVVLGASDQTVNAGYTGPFAVGGHVWVDRNGNAKSDPGEQPLSGVTVRLFLSGAKTPAKNVAGTLVAPVTTNASGYYVFDRLPAGSYVARFTAVSGYRFSTPPAGVTATFTVGAGAPNNQSTSAADVSMSGGALSAAVVDRAVTAGLQLIPISPTTPPAAQGSVPPPTHKPPTHKPPTHKPPTVKASTREPTATPLTSTAPPESSAPTSVPPMSSPTNSPGSGGGGAGSGGSGGSGGSRGDQAGRPHPLPISAALARPSDAFSSVGKVATSIGIAAATVLLLTFPSELFNLTLEENYAELRRDWRALPQRLRRFGRGSVAKHRAAAGENDEAEQIVHQPLRRRVWFAIVVALGALCGELLSPKVGLNRSSLDGYVAFVGALLIEVSVPAAVAMTYHRLRGKPLSHTVHALPGGLLIAGACVVISRVAGFQPGYLYGIVAGVVFTGKLGMRQKAHVGSLVALTALIVAIGSWILWLPVDEIASRPGANEAMIILDDLLASLLVGGLVNSVMRLLPLSVMPGAAIKSWHKGVWAGLLFLSVFGLIDVLLLSHRPGSKTSSASIVITAGLFLFFIAAAVGLREYCVVRARAVGARVQGWRAHLQELSSPIRKQNRRVARIAAGKSPTWLLSRAHSE